MVNIKKSRLNDFVRAKKKILFYCRTYFTDKLNNEDLKNVYEQIIGQKSVGIDIRSNRDYLSGHIPSTMNAPYHNLGWGKILKSWLNSTESAIILIGKDHETAIKAKEDLETVNLNVSTTLSDNLKGWIQAGLPVSSVLEISPFELYEHMPEWTVIDVREPWEWQLGTIKDSIKIPLNDLPKRISMLNKTKKYAIVCTHGNRSEVAAIFLSDNFLKAATMIGGMEKWEQESLPVEYETD